MDQLTKEWSTIQGPWRLTSLHFDTMNHRVRELWTKDEAPEDEATKTQSDSNIITELPEGPFGVSHCSCDFCLAHFASLDEV